MPKEERKAGRAKVFGGANPTGAAGGRGQHFLKNMSVVKAIVAKAAVRPTDIVLEIGPGTGVMTQLLLEKAKKVICCEIDPRMIVELRKRFQGTEHGHKLAILQGDVLQTALPYFDICVANIPYQISSGITFKLLGHRPFFRSAVIMYQEEFAQRLSAPPGSTLYSRLTVNAQLLSKVQQVMKVGRHNFRPPPKVESRVVRFEQRNPPPPINFKEWDGMVKRCFIRKNKTLNAIFKNKKYYLQLEENWKTVKALGDVDPAVAAAMGMTFGGGGGGAAAEEEDTLQQVKDAVAQVLAKDGIGERRPISFDVDDFVKLLHDFNAVGIHFS